MKHFLLLLTAFSPLVGCDTTGVEDVPPARDLFEGTIGGTANGVAWTDSLQATYDASSGLRLHGLAPAAPGRACGGLQLSFFLDAAPGVQDLRYFRPTTRTENVRGLLGRDGGDDVVCAFYTSTNDEANQITLVAGRTPGEFTGTFQTTLVVDRDESRRADTVRVENGRVAFRVALGG